MKRIVLCLWFACVICGVACGAKQRPNDEVPARMTPADEAAIDKSLADAGPDDEPNTSP